MNSPPPAARPWLSLLPPAGSLWADDGDGELSLVVGADPPAVLVLSGGALLRVPHWAFARRATRVA